MSDISMAVKAEVDMEQFQEIEDALSVILKIETGDTLTVSRRAGGFDVMYRDICITFQNGTVWQNAHRN